ncbi:hypothetical protein GCM10019016_098590 [Streptomyces prasinosporus]|uniref:Uncharacterized protein n=1 Tax=Streptomyces prasinosporus TaxID=68256 RepID=A0ABP6U4Y7_9ACTN
MHDNHPSFPGFEHVGLEDGHVPDITVRPAVLTLGLDPLLLPGHPEHRTPSPGERACFRQAAVVFPSVRDLHWTGQDVIGPTTDASGARDFGTVDSPTGTGDSCRLLGDRGEIDLQSDPPSLSVDRASTT